MDIRLVSTLTPEDEARVVRHIADALTGVLDALDVTYAIRIEAGGEELECRSNLLNVLPTSLTTVGVTRIQ